MPKSPDFDTRVNNFDNLPKRGPFPLAGHPNLPNDLIRRLHPIASSRDVGQPIDCTSARQPAPESSEEPQTDSILLSSTTIHQRNRFPTTALPLPNQRRLTTGRLVIPCFFQNIQEMASVPVLKSLRRPIPMSDNFHSQSFMGGTGANHVMLGHRATPSSGAHGQEEFQPPDLSHPNPNPLPRLRQPS